MKHKTVMIVSQTFLTSILVIYRIVAVAMLMSQIISSHHDKAVNAIFVL